MTRHSTWGEERDLLQKLRFDLNMPPKHTEGASDLPTAGIKFNISQLS